MHRSREGTCLFGYGSVNTFPRKHEPHNNTVTRETGLFSVGSAPMFYSENPRPAEGRLERVPRVEAGSNTSIVTLRVVGVDEKGSLDLRQ
jgi:hypothetical protein